MYTKLSTTAVSNREIHCRFHLATHLPFVSSRYIYKTYSLKIGIAEQLLAVGVHTEPIKTRMTQVCLMFRDQLQRSDTRHLEGQKSLQALKAEFDNLSTIVPRRSSLASSSSPLGSGNHAQGLRCCMLLLHCFSFHLHCFMLHLQGCSFTSSYVDTSVVGLHAAMMCSSTRHMLR